MCGIFGVFGSQAIERETIRTLFYHAEQRGRDSSGFVRSIPGDRYYVDKADTAASKLAQKIKFDSCDLVMGHSRLVTNGLSDNQPVLIDDVILIHNGIVVNESQLWSQSRRERTLEIDSEIILARFLDYLDEKIEPKDAGRRVLEECKGVVSAAIAIPKLGKLVLMSNNGSLYVGSKDSVIVFASESYALKALDCSEISQVLADALVFDIPQSGANVVCNERNSRELDLIPPLRFLESESRLLEYHYFSGRRCSRCVLPETMPFISFNDSGVCNYCENYVPRNKPKPIKELFELVEPYRRQGVRDCIVPFSGGRDSCYGLHLIVNDLKMNPITYTYDWGMVTDLGRRNISRMCSALGVENIIVAADIEQKRINIRKNLEAWLKSPHLGMISILTAGDKHFFRHVETIKKQTGIDLNLWGVNPLEVTHFKAGFLGVKPDFEESKVYNNGLLKQIRYHFLRTGAMFNSLGYFNTSIIDTLSGEYYRSIMKKTDYFHIFDYWKWDEEVVDSTLEAYEWEKAVDTTTTWRIGDGTAAFYNYVYYTVAGFSEHDTFRSNQIREGDLSRDEAIRLLEQENRPRYQNIKWYLDTLGLDFASVLKVVNSIPRLTPYKA